jgi:hypothetical protein
MSFALLYLGLAVAAAGVMLLGHWLFCRLTAQPCPACGSRWRTELTGEWDGEEDWRCLACGRHWGHRFAPPWSGGGHD